VRVVDPATTATSAPRFDAASIGRRRASSAREDVARDADESDARSAARAVKLAPRVTAPAAFHVSSAARPASVGVEASLGSSSPALSSRVPGTTRR
jgi:hypothetical protein